MTSSPVLPVASSRPGRRDTLANGPDRTFTASVAGAIGPQPHLGFVEVFGEAALNDRDKALEGAGEGAAAVIGGS